MSAEQKIRECQEMRDSAENDPTYTLRCIYGEKVFYVEDTEARMPGHCYSEAGVREMMRVSGCCEYHFDNMFPLPDEEDDEDANDE